MPQKHRSLRRQWAALHRLPGVGGGGSGGGGGVGAGALARGFAEDLGDFGGIERPLLDELGDEGVGGVESWAWAIECLGAHKKLIVSSRVVVCGGLPGICKALAIGVRNF